MDWYTFAQQPPMDPSDPQSWATAGLLIVLLAIYLGDKILSHLKNRGIDLQDTCHKIDELYDWHNHDDPDQPGVKIWWNQKYLAELLKEMVAIQRDQTTVLKEMRGEQANHAKILAQQTELLSAMIKTQEALLIQVQRLEEQSNKK